MNSAVRLPCRRANTTSTGLGVAADHGSLMVFSDPSGFTAAD
jgi:hypothetical protein